MSKKINAFRTVLGNPLTTHNYKVTCTLLGADISMMVAAAPVPTEKMRIITLFYMGERIQYPTVPANSGSWSCQVVDNEKGVVFKKALASKGVMWDQKTGNMIGLSGGLGVDIKLEILGLNEVAAFQTVMKNCFILGLDDNAVNAQDPTNPFKWNIQFAYDWLEDGDSTILGNIVNPLLGKL